MSFRKKPSKVLCCTACDHPVGEYDKTSTISTTNRQPVEEQQWWCAFCYSYNTVHWRAC